MSCSKASNFFILYLFGLPCYSYPWVHTKTHVWSSAMKNELYEDKNSTHTSAHTENVKDRINFQ